MKNLTQRLKVALLLLCGTLMLGGVIHADTFTNGSKIYLKPNGNWKKDGAVFRAKFYKDGADWWVSFTSVSGQDGLYECTVPGSDYYAVNLLRFPSDKGGSTNEGDSWNHIWSIPAQNGKNLITIDDGTWDETNNGYSWGTYSSGGGGETHNYTYTLKYWTPDTEIEIVPGEAKTTTKLAGKGFGIALKENGKDPVWYNFDGDAVKDIEIGDHTYNLKTGGNNFSVPANVGEAVVTLNVDANGIPVSLKVKASVKVTDTDYWLAGGFLNNWGYRVKFEPTEGNSKVRTATVTYNESNPQNKGFKITTKEKDSDGIWYSIGDNLIDKGVEVDLADKTAEPNMRLQTGAFNNTVVFTLTLDDYGYPLTLKADWEGENIVPQPTDDMPAYPIGVYTDGALVKYDKWPVVYLLGGTINNGHITPEYQMTKIAADHYELEFTARNTETWNTGDGYFGAGNQKMKVVAFNNPYSAQVELLTEIDKNFGKDRWKEGVRYKAILTKENGNWKIDFQLVDPEKKMPFLSMVGANWKQRVNAPTPDGKKTDDGWQEAWIQYDSRGQVLLDRKGKVMYNTMWPPRNPILFKTEITLNGTKDFTLSSKDLTFVAGETKTGAEWLAEYKAKGYSTYERTDNKVPEDGKHFYHQLVLDPNRNYTLYQVENMWINGRVKIWSGWSGYRNNGDAIWSWHSNWGHYEQKKEATQIAEESTVPLYNREGDVEFSKPTFFKYVDFFYDCDAPDSWARSVLFTELATGGAQIAALSTKDPKKVDSKNNYEVGNYQAALNDISNILDNNVTKVIIDCYKTISNGETQTDEMEGNVLTWTGSKNVKLFHEIFADKPDNSELESTGSSDNTTHSTGKWVLDPATYTNGDYFYQMRVYIDGQAEPITVNSNPFTIFRNDETITLNVYQLVKIEDIPANKSVSGNPEGHYVTFKGKSVDEPDVPVFPVYELWIENDTKFDEDPDNENWLVDEETGEVIGYINDENFKYRYKSVNTMPEYETYVDKKYGHTYFTDKVFIVGSVPSANEVDGYKFAAEDASTTPETPETPETSRAKIGDGPMKATWTEEWDRSRLQPEYGDRFMYVTNVGTFNQREFNLQMKYTTSFLDAETGNLVVQPGVVAVAEAATYQAVIPEPILKEAEVKVYYGKTLDQDDDNNSIGNFDYMGLTLANARYTNVCDYIEVEYPNVSRFMQKRIIDENVFTLKLDLPDDPKNEVTSWDNIYKFGLVDGDDSEDENNNNSAAVASKPMKPEIFTSLREMQLIKDPDKNYAYYSRGWEDTSLPIVSISDNRPVDFTHNIQSKTYDEENNLTGDAHTYRINDENAEDFGHIYSEYTINVMHREGYVPTPASIEPDAETKGHHNYVEHPAADGSTHSHLLRHNNVVYLPDNENLNKEFEDYYYVAIIDYDESVLGKLDNLAVDNADDESSFNLDDYIIDDKGNFPFKMDETTGTPLVDSETKAKIVNEEFNAEKKLHFAVPASKMLKGVSYPIVVRKDYGFTPLRQGHQEDFDAHDKKMLDIYQNHFSKNIKVLVSYLYPFSEEEYIPEETNPTGAPKHKPNRAVKDYSGSVIKSKADIWASTDLSNGNIVTSVSALNADEFGGVNVGKGFIEVSGNGVQITDASGVVIGLGEGRYDVVPGVYVVRYNGKTTKVVVR